MKICEECGRFGIKLGERDGNFFCEDCFNDVFPGLVFPDTPIRIPDKERSRAQELSKLKRVKIEQFLDETGSFDITIKFDVEKRVAVAYVMDNPNPVMIDLCIELNDYNTRRWIEYVLTRFKNKLFLSSEEITEKHRQSREGLRAFIEATEKIDVSQKEE